MRINTVDSGRVLLFTVEVQVENGLSWNKCGGISVSEEWRGRSCSRGPSSSKSAMMEVNRRGELMAIPDLFTPIPINELDAIKGGSKCHQGIFAPSLSGVPPVGSSARMAIGTKVSEPHGPSLPNRSSRFVTKVMAIWSVTSLRAVRVRYLSSIPAIIAVQVNSLAVRGGYWHESSRVSPDRRRGRGDRRKGVLAGWMGHEPSQSGLRF